MGGRLEANRVGLDTTKDQNNIGGNITAIESANLNIGGNFNQHSTTVSTGSKRRKCLYPRRGNKRAAKAGLYVVGSL